MRTESVLAVAVLAAAAAACDDPAPAEEPTFEAVVEQVLTPKCTFSQCHANPTIAASLDLTAERACDTLVNKPSCLFPDRLRVVPGSPEESFFFHKLTGEGLDQAPTGNCGSDSSTAVMTNLLMPFGAAELSDDEVQLVHGWIAAGAPCTGSGLPDKPMPTAPVIAAIAATGMVPLAGQTISFTVTLDKAAPETGQMIMVETDSAALSTPTQVVVPATKTAMQFDAYALRPTSRFTVRVRTGQSSKELVLRIGGLDVAEVLADPTGDDDQLQWVKLHNRTSIPIDLTDYKLQAGQSNYDLVSVGLTGTIPAGGCVVVGGPTASAANGDPVISQALDFSPNLTYGGTQATGVAVFDLGAAMVGGVVAPVDTMLVGAGNSAQLLGPDGDAPNPYCATPPSGTSALRTAAGACIQAPMQPRACP